MIIMFTSAVLMLLYNESFYFEFIAGRPEFKISTNVENLKSKITSLWNRLEGYFQLRLNAWVRFLTKKYHLP